MKSKTFVLETWGDLACFTRPEMKVERFSYPVITPSAARGIFDAIFSKPSRDPTKAQFRWQVEKVEVLKLPRFIALRRNEVKDKAPVVKIGKWMGGDEEPEPLWADGGKDQLGTDMKGRTQRQTMALKDVRYRIHAHIVPWPGQEARLKAFEEQFERRALQGKCFFQPCFGCREFPAFFELVEDPQECPKPVALDMGIGLMLYDVFDLSRPGTPDDEPKISLFRATVSNGVMEVPPYEDERVLKVS
jgi:CRISPR-associated protein Cas5d